MKRSRISFALLGLFAGIAHAQSSVTLYGILDAGINYTNNASGHPLYTMSQGIMQGSRFGFKGVEDLGGGMSAIFDLEAGTNIANGTAGQGGAEFGRQAWVGLSSRYGKVTLGRQVDSDSDFVGPFMVADQWGSGVSAHAGDIDNMNNTYRVNNSVKYMSVDYSGFTFGGMYGFGGVPGAPGRNQIFSLGAAYGHGPLTLGAAYVNIRDPNISYSGSNPNTLAPAGANITNPIYSGFASATTEQIIALGFAYQFGAATIGGNYSNVQFRGLGNAAVGPTRLANGTNVAGGTGKVNDVEVNFKYQVNPALLLGAAWTYTKINGNQSATYNQLTLGVDYFLSKRTDVYLLGAAERASGTNSQGQTAVADINLMSPSTSNQQTYVRLGIRHKF